MIVIDSNSTDRTVEIAQNHGAQIILYQWDGSYPKKRQWCLENIQTKSHYIFFLDADEVVTPTFTEKLKNLKFDCAGYFVKSTYVWKGKILHHGLMNNKLALFDKNKIEFPVINDLDIKGMGEIEGHYQPVLNSEYAHEKIGQIDQSILHYAYDDQEGWEDRHRRYANWEAAMIERGAYPKDPKVWREMLKTVFKHAPCRGVIAFIHSYIIKLGFLDGRAGFEFAQSRKHYYQMVNQARKEKRFKNQ